MRAIGADDGRIQPAHHAPFQFGRSGLAVLLMFLVGCGHTADLAYRTHPQPERIAEHRAPVPAASTGHELGQARRVVVDVANGCRIESALERERCLRLEAAAARVIQGSGREVVLASTSELDALALARQVGAQALVRLDASKVTYSKTLATPTVSAVADSHGNLDSAAESCDSVVRQALAERATHARTELGVRWVRAEDASVLWHYRDTAEGDVALPAQAIAARYEETDRRQATSSAPSARGGNTYVFLDHGHHHSDHCEHRHRRHRRDREGHDDRDAAGLLILSVLVVGLIVIAVAAAADEKTGWCGVLSVPQVPQANKRQLEQHLDDALILRLGNALAPLTPAESPMPVPAS